MAAELPRPGVEVVQVFRTVTPTVAQPTLVPCVVGPCKQIVEATVSSATGASTINPDAQVSLPAQFEATAGTGDPPEYTLSKTALEVSVNNKASVKVFFDAGTYTPATVVARVNAALDSYSETEMRAEKIGTDPSTGTSWRLRSVGKGDGNLLTIDPNGQTAGFVQGTVDLATLTLPADIGTGTLLVSIDGAAAVTITFANPANPAAILSQIDAVLLATGAATQAIGGELVITSASTNLGSASSVQITGGTVVSVLGLTVDQAGSGDGSSDSLLSAFGLSTYDVFFGETLYQGWEVKLPTTAFPDPRGNLAELVFEVPTIRSFVGTGTSVFEVLRTSALLRKGGSVTAPDDGNGDSLTPFLEMSGQDFTSASPVPSAAQVTGTAAPTFASLNGKTLIVGDGRHPRTVVFDNPANITDVVDQINAEFNIADGLIASSSGGFLRLTSTKLREDATTLAKGQDSHVVIYGGSAVTPTNYLDSAVTPTLKIGRFSGNPYKAAVGDEVYVDGVFVGKVLQVAPNGNTARLKLDKQVSTAFTGTSFYIVAKGLAALPAGDVNRPSPNLVVSDQGNLILKAGLLRDVAGAVVETVGTTALFPGKGPMYVSYKALRLDVTRVASNPGLLRFDAAADVAALLAPVNADNPLALGLYFASLNAPSIQITGLGVEGISADSPDGTVEAYTYAVEYLEAFEVYALAPMSHDATVGQVFRAHVDAMSEPANKGERVAIFNPEKPTHKLDALVASGTNGNTIGAGGVQFDTGVGNLTSLLLEAGLDPTNPFAVDDGLFLDIASDSKHYSVSAVSGSVVTITTTFSPGENDDGFYSTTDLNDSPLPAQLIEEPFALRIRGAALTLLDGTPDKSGMAETYQKLGQSISDRRFWQIMPDKCRAVIDGLEQQIEGYYMAAAIAGMVGQQPPQQSFTNYPMAGFTGVVGSNNYFSDKQLNQIAYGGNWIVVQDVQGAPLISRMALTTDMTSIETRTDSITKVVDFVAKFIRKALKVFIGRFNITQGFLDTLGTVLDGLLTYLKENGVIIDARVNNLIQDENAPDTVLIDISLDPPYPCNYIRVTLVI